MFVASKRSSSLQSRARVKQNPMFISATITNPNLSKKEGQGQKNPRPVTSRDLIFFKLRLHTPASAATSSVITNLYEPAIYDSIKDKEFESV